MDTDRIAGTVKDVGGQVQAAVGNATGDHKTELEGRFHEAEGKTQTTFGQTKDAVRDGANSLADAAQNAYNNAGSYGSQAQDTLKGIAGNATDTVKDAYNNSDRYIGQAKEAVSNAAGAASGYAQDVYNNPGDYLRQGADTVSHKVEENPLIALLIAGAVGYGLALLVHGRN